ncbi:unnamed protein product [Amoebophrya sp. A25]|nr:unnamed protein product [Amoebophrya sp. A25]|eukprot:GSA25T00007895001.1
MSDSEQEFEYESDSVVSDDGDEEAIVIENRFYEADDVKLSEPSRALAQFQSVVQLENERQSKGGVAVWKFKALQNIVILAARVGKHEEMYETHQELLALLSTVTRNDASEAINSILDTINAIYGSSAKDVVTSTKDAVPTTGAAGGGTVGGSTTAAAGDPIHAMYEMSLETLRANKNPSLWLSTCIKLAKLYLAQHERLTTSGRPISSGVHKAAEEQALANKIKALVPRMYEMMSENGIGGGAAGAMNNNSNTANTSSQWIEIYAVELQYLALVQDHERLKMLYPKTIELSSAIADPRNLAVIRECGGRYLYMRERQWQLAYNELFEAFQTYQATGNAPKAKLMLKFLVLANMLSESDINPFNSREAKVYAEDPEIKALMQLRQSLEEFSIEKLDQNLFLLTEDVLLAEYKEELESCTRSRIAAHLLQPYRSMRLQNLAGELNVNMEKTLQILGSLIRSGKVKGSIDEVKQLVLMEKKPTMREQQATARAEQIENWISKLEQIADAPLLSPAMANDITANLMNGAAGGPGGGPQGLSANQSLNNTPGGGGRGFGAGGGLGGLSLGGSHQGSPAVLA